MAVAAIIPQLGNTVENCVIVEWKKAVGQPVAEGEALVDVETDKAVMEVVSPAAGTVLAQFFAPGDLVPVLTNIAAIGQAGEDVSALRPGGYEKEAGRQVDRETSRQGGEDASKRAAAGIAQQTDAAPEFVGVSPRARNLAEREGMAEGTPEVLRPKSESRLKDTHAKHRFGLDEQGKPRPKIRCLTYAEAIFEAMLHRFYADPTMAAWGEENRDWGGAFGAYRGLTECLPYHRLFNTPISEGAIVGAAVGYALSGGRVVPELMYCDFMGRAGDEVLNQLSKWQAMSAGVLQMPLVLRVSVGAKYGAQHSQDWTSLVAHIPGLKVMFPATAYDAKGMLNLALAGTDPVVFFESQRLYPEPETLVAGGVPVNYYEVPMGEPALRRQGRDLTIATVGATLYRALEAADILQEKYGLSAEVIDARFINPLNYAPIVESVKKTGKALLASDACERGSFMNTMAANLSQLAFDYLDAPVAVIGARNWITPAAELEEEFFPQKE